MKTKVVLLERVASCCHDEFKIYAFEVSSTWDDPMGFIHALADGAPVHQVGSREAPAPYDDSVHLAHVQGWVSAMYVWQDRDTGDFKFAGTQPASMGG